MRDAPPAQQAASGWPHPLDLRASLVVFLVALPLCLGIAHASKAPLAAGLIAGIVGGMIVGALSGSHVMVSGPAAGLTAIVLDALHDVGTFERFLPAVVLGGVLQLVLWRLHLGGMVRFVHSAVIRGMLAAIGLILIMKQIPHALGYDKDPIGDHAFYQADNENTFSEILVALNHLLPGATIIGVLSVVILVAWKRVPAAMKAVPAPLVVVVAGVALNELFRVSAPALWIGTSHLVELPALASTADIAAFFPRPDWSALGDPVVWRIGVTLGLVASLESLLSLEATGRLDPQRREASPDRELLAQGAGNVVSGLLGGLPVTGVIVRSSANVDAGARTRWSGILHAGWLLAAVLFASALLNKIPLAALAGILLMTGYNLANPSVFRAAWNVGRVYFAQFAITVVAILFTDLLIGVLIGLLVGILEMIREQVIAPPLIQVSPPGAVCTRYRLPRQVTFFHKVGIERLLDGLKPGDRIEIDGRNTNSVDPDVLAVLHGFSAHAAEREVDYRLVGVPELPSGLAVAH